MAESTAVITLRLRIYFGIRSFGSEESGQFKILVFTNAPPLNQKRFCLTIPYNDNARKDMIIEVPWSYNSNTRQFPASAAIHAHCLMMLTNEEGLRGWERVGCARILLSDLVHNRQSEVCFSLPIPYQNVSLQRGTWTCTLMDASDLSKFTFASAQPLELVDRNRRSIEEWADNMVSRCAWLYDNTEGVDEFLRRLHSYYYHMSTTPFMPGFIYMLYEPFESPKEEFFGQALAYVLDRWAGLEKGKYANVSFEQYALNPRSQDEYDIAQRILAEVLVLPTVMFGYVDDQYVAADGHLEYNDSWFPALLSLTADCEDMARLVEITASKLLRLAKPENPKVQAMQTLARRFVVCQVLCTARAAKAGESDRSTSANISAMKEPISGHYTAMMFPCSMLATMLRAGQDPMTAFVSRGSSYSKRDVDFSDEVKTLLAFLDKQVEGKRNVKERIWELEGTGYTDPYMSGTVTERGKGTDLPDDSRAAQLIRKHMSATHHNSHLFSRMYGEKDNGVFFSGFTVSVVTSRFYHECTFPAGRVPFELAFLPKPAQGETGLKYGVRTFDLFKQEIEQMFAWPSYAISDVELRQAQRLLLEEPPMPSLDDATYNPWVAMRTTIPPAVVPPQKQSQTVDLYLHGDSHQQFPDVLPSVLKSLLSAKMISGYDVQWQPLGVQSRLRIRCWVPTLAEMEKVMQSPALLDSSSQMRQRGAQITTAAGVRTPVFMQRKKAEAKQSTQAFQVNSSDDTESLELEPVVDGSELSKLWYKLRDEYHEYDFQQALLSLEGSRPQWTREADENQVKLMEEYKSILNDSEAFAKSELVPIRAQPTFEQVLEAVQKVCARWPCVFSGMTYTPKTGIIVIDRPGVPLVIRERVACLWDRLFGEVQSVYRVYNTSLRYSPQYAKGNVRIAGTLGCRMYVHYQHRFFHLPHMYNLFLKDEDKLWDVYGFPKICILASLERESPDTTFWQRMRDLNPDVSAALFRPFIKSQPVPLVSKYCRTLFGEILCLDLSRLARYVKWREYSMHEFRMLATRVWNKTFRNGLMGADVQHGTTIHHGIYIYTLPYGINIPEAVKVKVRQFWDWVFPKCYNVYDLVTREWTSMVIGGPLGCDTRYTALARTLVSPRVISFQPAPEAPPESCDCPSLEGIERQVKGALDSNFRLPEVAVTPEKALLARGKVFEAAKHVVEIQLSATEQPRDLSLGKAIESALFEDLKIQRNHVRISRAGKNYVLDTTDGTSVPEEVRQAVGRALVRRVPSLSHRYDLIKGVYTPALVSGAFVSGLPWIFTHNEVETACASLESVTNKYTLEMTGPKKRKHDDVQKDEGKDEKERSKKETKLTPGTDWLKDLPKISPDPVLPPSGRTTEEWKARDQKEQTLLKRGLSPETVEEILDEQEAKDAALKQKELELIERGLPLKKREQILNPPKTLKTVIEEHGRTDVERKQIRDKRPLQPLAFDDDTEDSEVDSDGEEETIAQLDEPPLNQLALDLNPAPAVKSRRWRMGWDARYDEIALCQDLYAKATAGLEEMEKKIALKEWGTVLDRLLPQWNSEVPRIERCYRFIHLSAHCLATVVSPLVHECMVSLVAAQIDKSEVKAQLWRTNLTNALRLAAPIYAQAYIQVWRQIRAVTSRSREPLTNWQAIHHAIGVLSATRIETLYKLKPKDSEHNLPVKGGLFMQFFKDLLDDKVIVQDTYIHHNKLMPTWLLDPTGLPFCVWISKKRTVEWVQALKAKSPSLFVPPRGSALLHLGELIGSAPFVYDRIYKSLPKMTSLKLFKRCLRALDRERPNGADSGDTQKRPLTDHIASLLVEYRRPSEVKEPIFASMIDKLAQAGPIQAMLDTYELYRYASFWPDSLEIIARKRSAIIMRVLSHYKTDRARFEAAASDAKDEKDKDRDGLPRSPFRNSAKRMLEQGDALLARAEKLKGVLDQSFVSDFTSWLEANAKRINAMWGQGVINGINAQLATVYDSRERVESNRKELEQRLRHIRRQWSQLDQIAHQVSFWRFLYQTQLKRHSSEYNAWRKEYITDPSEGDFARFYHHRSLFLQAARIVENGTPEFANLFVQFEECVDILMRFNHVHVAYDKFFIFDYLLELLRAQDVALIKEPGASSSYQDPTEAEMTALAGWIDADTQTLPSLGPRWFDRLTTGDAGKYLLGNVEPDLLKRILDLAFAGAKKLIQVDLVEHVEGIWPRSVKRVAIRWTGEGAPSRGLRRHIRVVLDHVLPGVRLHKSTVADVSCLDWTSVNFVVPHGNVALSSESSTMDTTSTEGAREEIKVSSERYFAPIECVDTEQRALWLERMSSRESKKTREQGYPRPVLVHMDVSKQQTGDPLQMLDDMAAWRATIQLAQLADDKQRDLREIGQFGEKRVREQEMFL